MSELYYPLDVSLVTEWPGPRAGGYHYGTDFRAKKGTPLPACFDGVVVYAGGDGASGELYPNSGIWANGQGLTVDIQRADGLIARYGHLSRINVKVGQRVTAGETILGGAGDTGFSIGVHCHWELRWDRAWSGGAWADPRKLNAKSLEDMIMAISDADAKKIANAILDAKIPQKGSKTGGTTSGRRQLAWEDHQWASTKRPLEWIAKNGAKILALLTQIRTGSSETRSEVKELREDVAKLAAAVRSLGNGK